MEEVRDAPGPHHGSQGPGDRVDLVRALQALPEREREVVVLRHYADLSERAVADLLGVSVGTVKSSSSRGLRRVRRRRATLAAAVAAAAVVVAVVATGVVTAGGRDRTTSPPAGTSAPVTGSTLPGPGWHPRHPELSGRTTIRTAEGTYAVSVARGIMTVAVTQHGVAAPPASAALLESGAVWRQVLGTAGQPVLVGVAPRAAEQVVYQPAGGGEMAPHRVATAPAGDFTAYVVELTRPPAADPVARDVGWLTHDAGLPTWTIGEAGTGSIGIALDMDGEVPSLLAPYDVTVTGPPRTTSRPREAVVSFTITFEQVLGGTARLELQGGAAAVGTSGRELRVEGPDPESAFGWASVPLAGGRTLVWGVLPQGVASVAVRTTGGAGVGTPVIGAESGLAGTPFAVLVAGTPEQVVGFDARLTRRQSGVGVLR
ncbi:sigma factor-like helix-turn-helix DNA-binding protein [Phycicoccus ginsengisoli]